jgi:hypothetical protein
MHVQRVLKLSVGGKLDSLAIELKPNEDKSYKTVFLVKYGVLKLFIKAIKVLNINYKNLTYMYCWVTEFL